jgi:hypothetical protein
MAFFFGDGFDLYATMADITGYWDASSVNASSSNIVAGRFTGSRAINASGGGASRFEKASGSNDAVHHIVLAIQQTQALSGTQLNNFFTFFDGATAQCSVVFRNDGTILLTSGGPGGTILATYANAVLLVNTWYAFEFEVVINNTTGSIAVRKNGNPSNDFFLGSLNTRASANNYANKIQFGQSFGGSSPQNVDDLLWRSDVASVPWIGDVRCFTRRPLTDVSVQFSRSTLPNNVQMWGATGITNALSANQCEYIQIIPTYSGLITSISVACTNGGGGTGHVKMAIFSSANNTVGTLLATSNEVTNPGNAIIPFTFPTPARVVAGQPYWVAINQDASITYNVINSSSAGVSVITLTSPAYASWPVSNPGGTIATINVPGLLTITYTPGFNADCVSDPQQDGGATYIFDSTVGHADLYTISSIPTVPANIFGVITRGFFQKNDAGTRNAAVQLKSGAATVQGASTALNTAIWGWLYRTDLVDPATGVAWTPGGVNNVNIGPVVTA